MNVGIYIYDDAEVLDFAGPYEVFSVAGRLLGADELQVNLIGETGDPVTARHGLRVIPNFNITSHPPVDALIVVGGVHHAELTKPAVIDWISQTAADAQLVASVCTGAFLLAQSGLLDEVPVTTHWEDIAQLRRAYPQLDVREHVRWTRAGKTATSAGISAGIDMSLGLVAEFFNQQLATATARQMEYDYSAPQ
ncbi:MAG: DJ-1/PfpI family protein [Pseudomonadota bacterium]